jgi:hypothetical protein
MFFESGKAALLCTAEPFDQLGIHRDALLRATNDLSSLVGNRQRNGMQESRSALRLGRASRLYREL